MPRGTDITLEAASLLEHSIETLRWCRIHVNERLASENLREVQLVLTAVTLALDYEMDGDIDKANLALERAGAKYEVRALSEPKFDPALFDEGH